MKFESINPFTEKKLAQFDFISDEALGLALSKADDAQKQWRKVNVSERVKFFNKLATLIKEKHEELALLATLEMGKPLAEAKLEVLKCARGCEYYAANAPTLLQPKISVAETGKTVHQLYEPLGVIMGVFPWNFPYWQILRSAVPIVIAGNAILVKPAPNVPQCSLAIQQIIDECGLPDGLIQMVFATEQQVANCLADPRIKAATLTGSDKAGSAVASTAAKYIKKSVLELGGSDPFIVMEDADLEATLKQAITARFQNNGQSCIAAKRFILHEKIADEFLAKLTSKVAALNCGNPLDESTNIGPLARKDLRDKLSEQVTQSVNNGAVIHYQQTNFPDNGYFYSPTILTHINPNCDAYYQELFGPVVSIYVVNNDDEAVAMANATEYGLGASVWSKNIERAIAMANQIESGQVFINEMVKSQPSHPFGGVKKSGYGRELGEFGLLEFCNTKTLWV
jgi:succinate-semialdehyde dehydrogenase/glutarate-semialdehyde dehydrogenase